MRADITDVEVRSAEEVAPRVRQFGVAIWRGLVPTDITSAMIEPISANLKRKLSYISSAYGVLKLSVLPPALQEASVTPQIKEVFADALGAPNDLYVREIYVTRPGYYKPHPWHQDANAGNQEYHLMTWIAATPCGIDAPGLSFALSNPGKFIGGYAESEKAVASLPTISPVFAPGDAFFFDVFSLHKTNVTPEMPNSRVAYKLGARAIKKTA